MHLESNAGAERLDYPKRRQTQQSAVGTGRCVLGGVSSWTAAITRIGGVRSASCRRTEHCATSDCRRGIHGIRSGTFIV